MNRQQRRELSKIGGEKGDYLNSPCTIAETVQIAKGVAEDVMQSYVDHSSHLQVAISLQIEILKDVVIKAGLITEEEFKERYIKQAELFNQMQQEALNKDKEIKSTGNPNMEAKVNDIEIQKI